MTNAEKFEEVFGFTPLDECIIPDSMCHQDPLDLHSSCIRCPYLNWWDKEYETPDRLPFE